jgi:hypothetical protein
MDKIPLWPYLSKLQQTSWGAGLLGFFINFTTTVSSGGVVVYRNWAALVLGGITILLGIASIPESLQAEEHRSEKLAAVGIAFLVGVLHIARGLGMFYSG